MSKLTKVVVAVVALFMIYVVYLLTATEDIGSFENVRASGEINRSMRVWVVGSKGFERDRSNNIISFYARDKYDQEAVVSLQEPAPPEIVNAEVVELLGHLHGNNFIALRVSIVKLAE